MIAQQVTELLAKMTLREKVGQLTQCGNSIYNEDYKIGWELLRQGRIGSFLGIGDVAQANELQRIAIDETRLGIPLLLGFDVIHGYRTIFPVPWAEACSWEPELARQTAEAATREAVANGVNWIYAPMIDIARDPRWGRGVEGAGEDTHLVAKFAEARVKGIQGETLADGWHAAACAKHFVAYGAAIGGRDYNSVELAPQTLHDVY
ncbi:MAG: glycoside hydrolase family 3 N-terminal domain-containing protein, partial [Lentisphaeria bacterium]